jgi:hypothetical protein
MLYLEYQEGLRWSSYRRNQHWLVLQGRSVAQHAANVSDKRVSHCTNLSGDAWPDFVAMLEDVKLIIVALQYSSFACLTVYDEPEPPFSPR